MKTGTSRQILQTLKKKKKEIQLTPLGTHASVDGVTKSQTQLSD